MKKIELTETQQKFAMLAMENKRLSDKLTAIEKDLVAHYKSRAYYNSFEYAKTLLDRHFGTETVYRTKEYEVE